MNLKKPIFVMSESFLFLILSFASICHVPPLGQRQDSERMTSITVMLILISSALSFATLLMPMLDQRKDTTRTRQADASTSINASTSTNASTNANASTSTSTNPATSLSRSATNNGYSNPEKVCKDQFGIAFGSVILPLLFYNISCNSNWDDGYSPSNDESQIQLYSVLSAGVGASLAIANALSCPLSACTPSSSTTTTTSLHELRRRQYDILRYLKRIYPIMLAIILGTCGIIKVPTEFQYESFYQQIIQQNPLPIATFLVFGTMQFILLLSYDANMN